MMQGMVIDMEEAKLQTLAQVKAFLDGTRDVAFRVPKAERHQFIERVLKRFGYARHGRADKGVLLRYIERMTGLSPQQVTRLIRQYRKDGRLSKRRGAPKHSFTRRFTAMDAALLAEMDALHGTLSGPATKKLMERALLVFGDARFERLAGISVSHLYNLRGGKQYQNKRRHWTRTRPTGVPHRPAPRTATQRLARLHPHRQRASRRSGWGERGVPHQRGELRDPVPVGRYLREDQ
jgi:hypothetical protein